MADPLTLIVLVATGWSPAGTEALMRAARESLGPETHIDLRDVPGEPTDALALAVERRDHADAVVELGWRDRKRRQASMRVHVARGRRWIQRWLTFEPFDVEVERGRTLGYAMASILPDPFPHLIATQAQAAPDSSAPTSPAPPPAPPLQPTQTMPELPVTARSETRGSRGWDASRGFPAAIDFLGLGVLGIGGNAGGIGGQVAAQWFFVSPLSLRVGGGVYGGSIDEVGARTLTILLSAGIAVHVRRASLARPFGVSIRVDYLVLDETAKAVATQDAPSAWVSGLDAVVDASWMFVQGTELLAGGGFQDVFTSVDVIGPNNQVLATIPGFRVVGEVGLRLSF
jgi:hypothetical protein